MEHIQLLRLIESDIAFAILCATGSLNTSLMMEVDLVKEADPSIFNYLSNLSFGHVGTGNNIFECIRQHKDSIERLKEDLRECTY